MPPNPLSSRFCSRYINFGAGAHLPLAECCCFCFLSGPVCSKQQVESLLQGVLSLQETSMSACQVPLQGLHWCYHMADFHTCTDRGSVIPTKGTMRCLRTWVICHTRRGRGSPRLGELALVSLGKGRLRVLESGQVD